MQENVTAGEHDDGTGSYTCEEASEWIRTDEGQEMWSCLTAQGVWSHCCATTTPTGEPPAVENQCNQQFDQTCTECDSWAYCSQAPNDECSNAPEQCGEACSVYVYC